MYGRRASTTTGLTWGYYGGRLGGSTVANGTVTLTNGTNYVVASRSTGAVSTSTSTTNWNATNDYARLYKIVAASSQVSSHEDHRPAASASCRPRCAGAASIRRAPPTLVDADSDAFILHPSADTTAARVHHPGELIGSMAGRHRDRDHQPEQRGHDHDQHHDRHHAPGRRRHHQQPNPGGQRLGQGKEDHRHRMDHPRGGSDMSAVQDNKVTWRPLPERVMATLMEQIDEHARRSHVEQAQAIADGIRAAVTDPVVVRGSWTR